MAARQKSAGISRSRPRTNANAPALTCLPTMQFGHKRLICHHNLIGRPTKSAIGDAPARRRHPRGQRRRQALLTNASALVG